MLNEKQLDEIREHLERAQNPVFLYDNDADGLCSYLLFRRWLGRGKGVAIRSYPDMNESYAKKAIDLGADYVFILDKPLVSNAFMDVLMNAHIPVVWVDHHEIQGVDLSGYENLSTYNAAIQLNDNEIKEGAAPVTYWAYQVTKRKEDLWIAVMGCIADHYLPDIAREFGEKNPEFWGKVEKPFDAYYKTEIGKIAMSLNFGLKDSTTHIVELQNFLITCNGPNDVLSEVKNNENFRTRYNDIMKKYEYYIEEARKSFFGDLLFFDYGGNTSMSADLANELCFYYPDKYVAVAFIKGGIANVSMRGKGVKKIIERILKEFPGASGGGHEGAVGARLKSSDLARFREMLEKEVNNK